MTEPYGIENVIARAKLVALADQEQLFVHFFTTVSVSMTMAL